VISIKCQEEYKLYGGGTRIRMKDTGNRGPFMGRLSDGSYSPSL